MNKHQRKEIIISFFLIFKYKIQISRGEGEIGAKARKEGNEGGRKGGGKGGGICSMEGTGRKVKRKGRGEGGGGAGSWGYGSRFLIFHFLILACFR